MKCIKTQAEIAETHASAPGYIPIDGALFFKTSVYVSASQSICLQAAMCQNAHLAVRRRLLQVGP